jgi:integrase
MASIRKLPNGKWQAQFRPVPGGRQVTRTATRRADVQRWLDEQTAAIVTGMYADPRSGKITFGSYFDEWSKRQIWTFGTSRAMALTVRSATFVDLPLGAITKAHVEQWVKVMQTQDRGVESDGQIRPPGLSPQTIHTRFVNARTVFRAAVADRKIPTDPSLGVRLPQVRRASKSMRIPDVDQLRDVLGKAADHQRALFALCAFAGLRLGEVSAIKVGDIDFMKREIHVRRQTQKVTGTAQEVRLPKYGSERTVSAADGLLRLLSAHVALLELQGQPDAWLFPSESRGPAAPSTVHHAWLMARDAAKVPDFTLHDLRHFYASGLIAAGCDVSTVQHALGHSSPSITLNTYTHLWPKAEDRTRRAAQGLVDQVFGAPDEFLTNASTAPA